MERRQLGQSELNISTLGLGSWAIGGNIGEWGWGVQSEKESIAVIHAALERGINWIDTAPAYGLGNSERVIAKALKQTRYTPYVFTKCGFRWNDGESELKPTLLRQSILEEVDNSLSRLEVDCIDLYQIHSPNPQQDIEQAWETLSELKRIGKVRHIGVSNFSKSQLEAVNKIAPVTSMQPPYSLINQSVAVEVLPWCQNNNVGVINHSSMGHGLLTGRWNTERRTNLEASDWRHKSHLFTDPVFSQVLDAVDKLSSMAADKHALVAQLSLAWTLNHPATTGTIIGARNIQQLEDLLPACELPLSQDDMTLIHQQFDPIKNS